MKIYKKIVLVFLAIISSTHIVSAAMTPMTINCDLDAEAERVKDKNKRIKTFTDIYWQTLTSEIQRSLPSSLQLKGNIIGDFHFNNLGIYYNFDKTINRPQLVLNDLDDSGNNYIVGDLIKYLAFLRTFEIKNEEKGSKKDETILGKDAFRFEKIFDAYIEGLRNKNFPLSPEFQKMITINESDAADERNKYITNQSEGFGNIESSVDPKLQSSFAEFEKMPILKANRVIGRHSQVNGSGSSQGQQRFLYLLQNPSSPAAKAIVEFKQLACSASNSAKSQDLSLIYSGMTNYLKLQNQTALYPIFLARTDLVKVEIKLDSKTTDKKVYLLREKQNNLMGDVVKKSLKKGHYQELAETMAYLLGQFHSNQVNATFIDQLSKSSTEIFTTCQNTNQRFFDLTSKKAMK